MFVVTAVYAYKLKPTIILYESLYQYILRYYAWEIFGGEEFWQTTQVKAIDKENLANKLVIAYAIYIFCVSAKKILTNGS